MVSEPQDLAAYCLQNTRILQLTFRFLPQEEYAAEGIDWSYVEFIDNQECLDLLEGSPVNPSLAVFPLIDEACRMPRATYQVGLYRTYNNLPCLLALYFYLFGV